LVFLVRGVITNEFLQREIRKQLPEIPQEQVLAEPAQRNTAPCITLAAHILPERDREAVMGVFPADHLILKEARFRKYVKAAFQAAQKMSVVVLGMAQRWPEMGTVY
jgi:mannose-1-phosphate guanylyltransferase